MDLPDRHDRRDDDMGERKTVFLGMRIQDGKPFFPGWVGRSLDIGAGQFIIRAEGEEGGSRIEEGDALEPGAKEGGRVLHFF